MKPVVFIIDPSNFTPHYDIALCNALSDQHLDVELWTSSWDYEDLSMYPCRFKRILGFYSLAGNLCNHGALAPRGKRRLLKGLEHPFNWIRLLCRIAREKPFNALVHIQWNAMPSFDWAFMYILRVMGFPIVFTAHNVVPHDPQLGDHFFAGLAYRMADAIIVHAEENKRELESLFRSNTSKVHVIPFGTFNDFLLPYPPISKSEARRKIGLPEHAKVLLFFGRIRPYKGLEYLIKATSLAAKKVSSLVLLIVGTCSDFHPYRRLIEEWGIEGNVLACLSPMPTSENRVYFQAADIVVLPYVHIYQSIVVYMAAANKKPAIVTRTGGLPDVVEERKSGFLVPPKDIQALAEAIVGCFNLSAEQIMQMGEYAYELSAQRFGWSGIARRTIQLYYSLLSHETRL